LKRVVFLDAGVITLATHPRANPEAVDCLRWLHSLVAAKVRICIAEITDYEVRREYVRRIDKGDAKAKDAAQALQLLDRMIVEFRYVPIATPAMRRAAQLWANAWNARVPTAHEKELDCDVVLSAQAELDKAPDEALTVATSNVRHIARYVPADTWRNVTP
jgi:predicted nucleic acid-binding protein